MGDWLTEINNLDDSTNDFRQPRPGVVDGVSILHCNSLCCLILMMEDTWIAYPTTSNFKFTWASWRRTVDAMQPKMAYFSRRGQCDDDYDNDTAKPRVRIHQARAQCVTTGVPPVAGKPPTFGRSLPTISEAGVILGICRLASTI
ncbi:hypothetical protein E2C01_015228 [Portunus trituberculatus]|uniref:Uncharacterized protein n=1 Tax=Portunus trituberculatus TaxID=210409 RepID=A0A5B7DMK9_PORTR|nr:hypothetical protein [Portunus trituberculatus]